MTHEELLALTNALYPFAPDEQDEMNETEGMYAEAMGVISQALPDIYYAALETAWAGAGRQPCRRQPAPGPRLHRRRMRQRGGLGRPL